MSDAAPVPPDLLAHAAFLRRLARTLLADGHGAEDVVQETWRAVLEHPPARPGELGAWLARVTRNFALRRRRAEANRGARERRVARAEAYSAAEASLERTETLQRVLDAVHALEEPYRATILARFYEDLPPRAIAARAGIPVETVNTRLKRALAQLRRRIERDQHDWRSALGLLAGSSPCLPPHAGTAAAGLVLMKTKASILVLLLALGFVLWNSMERPRPSRLLATPVLEPDLDPTPMQGAALASARTELAALSQVTGADTDSVVPTAVLEVRVFDGVERRPLEDFAVLVYGSARTMPDGGMEYEGGYSSAKAEGGIARRELDVPEPGGRRLRVALTAPDLGERWAKLGYGPAHRLEQEVLLLPGETEQVMFVIPERGVVRGIVVDEQGSPIPDALVFFGEVTRARGDEPFKPVRMQRIEDGARTGADGWFDLRGDGSVVSALHPDFSEATQPVEHAGHIVLGALGAIRGRLLDVDGLLVADALLHLGHPSEGPEHSSSATTDASGSFRFERVPAGAHALWRDTGHGNGELLLGVRVTPGAEVEVEVRLWNPRPLELDIPALAPDEGSALQGLIVGFDETFGLCAIQHGRVEGNVVPGRYWLATRQGFAATLTVDEGAARARVELGSAPLVVRSTQRQNVQVVPSGADPFLRLAAARVWIKAEGETEARFRLHPGRYLLVGSHGAILRELELPPAGLMLALE